MYTVCVSRAFVAQHYLTVPDPGPEGDLHSHTYEAEVRLSGPDLDEYEYLVDIDELTAVVDAVVDRYRDATLNELPEFDGVNPSVERFARVFYDRCLDALDDERIQLAEVRIWEDDVAWAAYEE